MDAALGSIYMVHICCMNGCCYSGSSACWTVRMWCRLFRSGSNDQSITIFASASWERETPCLILESTGNDHAWYIVLMRMHVDAGSFNLSSLTCVGQPAGIPSVRSTWRDRYCAIFRQMFLKKNLLARSPQFYPSFIHANLSLDFVPTTNMGKKINWPNLEICQMEDIAY
jgi:hypothetical protein